MNPATYLGVAHQENGSNVLDSCFDVKRCQILHHVWDAAALAQSHLEDLHGGNVGGETRERLLPASSDANQEKIGSWGFHCTIDLVMMVVNMVENEEDLNYPANKTHCILKENQIHGSVELVVTLRGD